MKNMWNDRIKEFGVKIFKRRFQNSFFLLQSQRTVSLAGSSQCSLLVYLSHARDVTHSDMAGCFQPSVFAKSPRWCNG